MKLSKYTWVLMIIFDTVSLFFYRLILAIFTGLPVLQGNITLNPTTGNV